MWAHQSALRQQSMSHQKRLLTELAKELINVEEKGLFKDHHSSDLLRSLLQILWKLCLQVRKKGERYKTTISSLVSQRRQSVIIRIWPKHPIIDLIMNQTKLLNSSVQHQIRNG
jgi:hypothetical protein